MPDTNILLLVSCIERKLSISQSVELNRRSMKMDLFFSLGPLPVRLVSTVPPDRRGHAVTLCPARSKVRWLASVVFSGACPSRFLLVRKPQYTFLFRLNNRKRWYPSVTCR